MVTADQVRDLLRYDPATGEFRWRKSIGGVNPAAQEAGYINNKGYRMIQIGGRLYMAHRLAWLVAYNAWPIGQIDHKNRCRADNRLDNLRVASNRQNAGNRAVQPVSKSGLKGVRRLLGRNKPWQAYITVNRKKVWLGYYETKEAASRAYMDAAVKYFGEFARAS